MPSQNVLAEKQAIVEDLATKMSKATAGVLVRYQGITVDQDTKLRKELREANVDYAVIKNTLIGRACDKAGLGDMKSQLEGMSALALSYDDQVALAKILKKTSDDVDSFEIRAGILDGKVVDVDVVNDLASTPTREVMIGKILGSLTSSFYGLAIALNAVAEQKEAGTNESSAKAEPAAEEAPAAE